MEIGHRADLPLLLSERAAQLLAEQGVPGTGQPNQGQPTVLDGEHPAAAIVRVFGNLETPGRPSPHGERRPTGLKLDSALRENEELDAIEWEAILGTKLIPVGEDYRGYMEFYVAENGAVFAFGLVAYMFALAGRDFRDFVDRALFGDLFNPMIRPQDSGAEMYGYWYARSHPLVYHYTTDFPPKG